MKKLLTIAFLLIMLCGCQTKEEREEKKKQEDIKKITEELDKTKITEEAKKWLVSTKTDKVITIFCMSTSKKCETLKKVNEELTKKYKLLTYYYNLDEIDEETKVTLKSTYDIKDYVGYTPYIFITSNEKLINTHTDTFTEEEYIDFLKENKIISEN